MLSFFRTIRAKLIFSFVVFFLLIGGIILIDFWSEYKSNIMRKTTDRLSRIELNSQTAKKLEYFFLNNETISPKFYESGVSENLQERRKCLNQIQRDLKFLLSNINDDTQEKQVKTLMKDFERYEKFFGELLNNIKKRGFKSYGVEGKMRQHIHEIEESPQIDPVLLLTIRRHEKDFIIRKQEVYISQLQHALAQLEARLPAQNLKLREHLNAYRESFNELARLEKVIGFDNKSGLKGKLLSIDEALENTAKKLGKNIREANATIIFRNELVQIIVVIICSLLTVFFAYYLTKLLSEPIQNLSLGIHRVIESNFDEALVLEKPKSNDEIAMLSQDVSKLVAQVQVSFGEVKRYSAQIEEKQKILMNGVNYAKRIQNAILPTQDLAEHFRKVGIVYRPQYDVSGDFYWFTKRKGLLYVAVGDCTGKGVAGAVMSMIANTLLNDVVNKQKISEPNAILAALDGEFQAALSAQYSEDSMEIALCRFQTSQEDNVKYEVDFAGARSNIFYSNGWEIIELKGDRSLIGGRKQEVANFTNQHFKIKKENFVYFVTDGLSNQPNAEKKRFGSPQLKELLGKLLHLPVKEQTQRLNEKIDDFLEGSRQRDDITALILKA